MANQRRIRTDLLVSGNAAVAGDTALTGTLVVTGSSTFNGGVAGNTVFSGATVTFQNDVLVSDDLTVTGDLVVSGAFSFAGGAVFPDDTFYVHDEVDPTKRFALNLGGAATGTYGNLVFVQTASRDYTFPDATMSVVGHDTTQVLTNKTIDADLNTITNIEDADIKSGAAIARAKIAAGTADHVVINAGDGSLNSEAQLSPLRGGTGQNFSAASGVIKVSAGVFSAALILNADVDAAAAIARTKLASGTANHVLVNDGAGVMSSEAALDETRGGTAQTTYAAGDTLYASGSDVLAKRTIGNPGQVSKVNSSSLPAWEEPTDPALETRIVEEWISNAGGSNNWNQIAGGAGASSATTLTSATTNTHGILELTTGTTAAGFIHRTLGGVGTGAFTAGVQLGGGQMVIEARQLVEDLSTGVEEYNTQVGLKGAYTASTDHVICTYNRALYGNNFQLITRAASVDTIVDSGIPVVADQWYKIKLIINAAGTSVDLYIDGALVANSVTNIPTAINVAPIITMIKSVGTTARMSRWDYYRLYQRYTSAK